MKRFSWYFSILSFSILVVYGLGRLYYQVTAGFLVSNITSNFTFQPQWEVQPLVFSENRELSEALEQPYFYLGKGANHMYLVA